VVLDITNAGGVRKAYEQIRKNTADTDIDDTAGISVQKMLPRGDFELIAGARKDENFGPVLLFGLGGVLAEELKDRSIALPPLNRLLARRMIEDTRIYKVLNSHRNYNDLDVVQIETLLIRLSQLVTDFAEISEIDINPLAIIGDRVVALDARVIVIPSEMDAPLHLAISPYPNQYEEEIEIEGVGHLTLRPIRPEDAPLLEGLFDSLSQQSVYYRFFNLIRRLPHHMLAKYTQIDYDREIAMVAISSSGALEKMLGVSRVIASGNRKSAEFAVVVADEWQGKGIGAVLLERCLDYAKTKNIESIWAVVLPGNTKMLAMAKKMGFEITYHHSRGEYELNLDLRYSSRAPIPGKIPA
jgi:acetyltransferase